MNQSESAWEVSVHLDALAVGTSPLSALFGRGYWVVPVVSWPRYVAERLPVGRLVVVAAMVLGLWPVLLNELFNLLVPGLGVTVWAARMWLALCGALCVLLMLCAVDGWRRIVSAADHLDEMVPDSPRRRALIELWLGRLLSRWMQLAVAVPTTIGVVVVLHLVRPALEPEVPVGLASYVMVGWLGFLGANVVYWLCAMGALPRRLERCAPVRLVRHDPAMTPGLVALADGYVYVAATMSVGVLVTEILALMLPNRSDSMLLSGLVVWFPILAGVIALWAAIQPYFPIHRMARRTWRETLRDLSTAMETGEANRPGASAELYFHVRALSLLPINTGTVVQYCAAIIGVVGGFAIPKLLT